MSGWLVSGLSASRQLAGQSCPVTKISILTEENASLCQPSHPPGDNSWDTDLASAGSQTPGLSAASLLDGSSPGFRRTTEAFLPAIAGRQARKFCCKVYTVDKSLHGRTLLNPGLIQLRGLFDGLMNDGTYIRGGLETR